MKKVIVVFLSLMMLLCVGCAKEEPLPSETTVPETTVPETTVPETTEATIPVPEVVNATAEVNGVPAVLTVVSCGDSVDVVDSYDEKHVIVKTEQGYGLVEKNLIHMESEPDYEIWTGYATYKAAVYDNFHLTGDAVETLNYNAKVEVLADLGYCYYIRYEEKNGYMAIDDLSKWPIGGGGSSGGGGGGGSSGGADGGDIYLQNQSRITFLSVITPQEGSVSGKAAVLADDVEIILGYFDRGDNIPVVAEKGIADDWEGFCTVYLDGLYAYVPQELVRMEGEEAYSEWDGFSKYNAVIYEDRWLQSNPSDRLNINADVHVLHELDNSYFVEVDGMTGFMKKDDVSEYRFSTGGGGSSDSGGGGSAPEWSPPAL